MESLRRFWGLRREGEPTMAKVKIKYQLSFFAFEFLGDLRQKNKQTVLWISGLSHKWTRYKIHNLKTGLLNGVSQVTSNRHSSMVPPSYIIPSRDYTLLQYSVTDTILVTSRAFLVTVTSLPLHRYRYICHYRSPPLLLDYPWISSGNFLLILLHAKVELAVQLNITLNNRTLAELPSKLLFPLPML